MSALGHHLNHWRRVSWFPILLVLFVLGCRAEQPARPSAGVATCPQSLPLLVSEDDLSPAQVSVERLAAWTKALSASELSGRSNYRAEESARVARSIRDAFLETGVEPPPGNRGYCQGIDFEPVLYNVIGHVGRSSRPGRPEKPVVVLAAHYDGQGTTPAGKLLPGADDNASGVAALLEVGRLLSERELAVEVVLLATAGEEIGRLGALRYANAPTVDPARIEAVFALDMVGRTTLGVGSGLGYRLASPGEGDPEAQAKWQATLERRGLPAVDLAAAENPTAADAEAEHTGDPREPEPASEAAALAKQMAGAVSDADAFAAIAPSILITTGLHRDWHQTSDSWEKVDPHRTAEVVRAMVDMITNW